MVASVLPLGLWTSAAVRKHREGNRNSFNIQFPPQTLHSYGERQPSSFNCIYMPGINMYLHSPSPTKVKLLTGGERRENRCCSSVGTGRIRNGATTSWIMPNLKNQKMLSRVHLGWVEGSDAGVIDDDRIILDPSSSLGMFVRRCLLAFNVMSFEAVYMMCSTNSRQPLVPASELNVNLSNSSGCDL